MDKQVIKKSDKNYLKFLIIIPLIILLLIVSAYTFRGWIRMTMLPAAVRIIYGNSAQRTYENELKKIGDPFLQLGYGPKEQEISLCKTAFAKGIKTQVACDYTARAWYEIAQDEASKATLNTNAAKLQESLRVNGWEGYFEITDTNSLTGLIRDISSGIDYHPDATYIKTVDGTTCFLSTHTAFSTPNPPAIGTSLNCGRIHNVFGDPTAEIFNLIPE